MHFRDACFKRWNRAAPGSNPDAVNCFGPPLPQGPPHEFRKMFDSHMRALMLFFTPDIEIYAKIEPLCGDGALSETVARCP